MIPEQWRHLWADCFLLSGFADNGNALLELDGTTLEIRSTSQEMSGVLPAPSFVETVVMPLEDALVYGISFLTFDIAIGLNMRKMLEEEKNVNESSARIGTPEQFAPALESERKR